MPGGIPIEALFAPIFVISVAVEWWSVKTGRASGRYETADALSSMAMGLGNAIIGICIERDSRASVYEVLPIYNHGAEGRNKAFCNSFGLFCSRLSLGLKGSQEGASSA